MKNEDDAHYKVSKTKSIISMHMQSKIKLGHKSEYVNKLDLRN